MIFHRTEALDLLANCTFTTIFHCISFHRLLFFLHFSLAYFLSLVFSSWKIAMRKIVTSNDLNLLLIFFFLVKMTSIDFIVMCLFGLLQSLNMLISLLTIRKTFTTFLCRVHLIWFSVAAILWAYSFSFYYGSFISR